MPASIEGAAPATPGFCASDPLAKTRKIDKNSHFGFISSGGENLLASVSDTRWNRVCWLRVWAGWNRQELPIKVHLTPLRRRNIHLRYDTRESEKVAGPGEIFGPVSGCLYSRSATEQSKNYVDVHLGRNIPVLRMCSSNPGPNSWRKNFSSRRALK